MDESSFEEIAAFKANKERLLGRLLNRSYRYMSDIAADYLHGIGYENLRVGHIVALVHIELQGTNINQLAAGAGMTKQGMSKLIKELQTEGFVAVEKDPTDARALIVKLTEQGFKVMVDWKNCTKYINQKFSEVLGESKLETLKDLLLELVQEYETNYTSSPRNEPVYPMLKNNWQKLK